MSYVTVTEKIPGQVTKEKSFAFDRVFCEPETNQDVYKNCVADLVDHALEGQNSTCFAWGAMGNSRVFNQKNNAVLQDFSFVFVNLNFFFFGKTKSRSFIFFFLQNELMCFGKVTC